MAPTLTETRPHDQNGFLPDDPPEYQAPEDDDAFAALCDAYLPAGQPPF